MRRTLGPGSMTLGGLLKHLALVEDEYFTRQLAGAPTLSPPFDAVDFDADPDWEWRTAADDVPEELLALWEAVRGAVARERRRGVRRGGPDVRSAVAWIDGEPPTLRRLMVDMIEEYARHTGHADLIRESIDGLVGEGLPRRPPTRDHRPVGAAVRRHRDRAPARLARPAARDVPLEGRRRSTPTGSRTRRHRPPR